MLAMMNIGPATRAWNVGGADAYTTAVVNEVH